jgi:uncharacterized protein YkwD
MARLLRHGVLDEAGRLTRTKPSRRRFIQLAAALALFVLAIASSGCQLAIDAEIETYAGVNAVRTEGGLPPLEASQELADVARLHSQDMAANHRIQHEFDNGCTVICVMDALGIEHAWAGENTESNNWEWTETAYRAVAKWRSDPEHLANMMNCHYTRFGAGVTQGSDGRIYYSMVFEGHADC